MGFCIGICPENAISIEDRHTIEFNREKAETQPGKKVSSSNPSSFRNAYSSSLLPEILKAIDHGAKVKLLISLRYMFLAPVFYARKEAFDKVKKGMEIRLAHNFASSFGVVDDSAVILFQLHPRDKDRILSVVKIWDAGLAKNLGEEFDSLWNWGEELDLEKFARERELRGSRNG
jgi:HTH-type transcriptional regulator, sugar sensing transcriptional regulator